MRIIALILFGLLSSSSNAQSDSTLTKTNPSISVLSQELLRIDSIVNFIDTNKNLYLVDSAKGKVDYTYRIRNGSWTTTALLTDSASSLPVGLIHIRTGPNDRIFFAHKDIQECTFYFENGHIIMAKLEITFINRFRKNKKQEKKVYYQKNKAIFDSAPEIIKYTHPILKQNVRLAWKSIFKGSIPLIIN